MLDDTLHSLHTTTLQHHQFEQIAILLQVHKTLGRARPFPKLYLIALGIKPGRTRAPTCIKTQIIGGI